MCRRLPPILQPEKTKARIHTHAATRTCYNSGWNSDQCPGRAKMSIHKLSRGSSAPLLASFLLVMFSACEFETGPVGDPSRAQPDQGEATKHFVAASKGNVRFFVADAEFQEGNLDDFAKPSESRHTGKHATSAHSLRQGKGAVLGWRYYKPSPQGVTDLEF